MNKPKLQQKKDSTKRQIRDFFQTPNYGTDLIVPYLPKVRIWECAAGSGKIINRLVEKGFIVRQSDIESGVNFLTDTPLFDFQCIVTNVPFSLKKEFYERCLFWQVPFALLMPVDFCGWILRAMERDDCKWLIPTRRIDFITPTGRSGKNSGAQFHSGWLTYKIDLPKQITVVELTTAEKENI